MSKLPELPELLDTLPGPAAAGKRGASQPSSDSAQGDGAAAISDSAGDSGRSTSSADSAGDSADSGAEASGSAATLAAGVPPIDSTPATSGEHLPFQSWERYKLVSF